MVLIVEGDAKMIICMTLHDAGATGVIEDFIDSFLNRVSTVNEGAETKNRFVSPANPNSKSMPSEEDKVFIQSYIIDRWYNYVDFVYDEVYSTNVYDYIDEDRIEHGYEYVDEDLIKYLKENFCACVQMSYMDKDEDNEFVYYFTSNQMYITQRGVIYGTF